MLISRPWMVALSFIVIAVLLWRLSRIGRRPSSYPPGPPTLPLIGNLHQIPSVNPHLQFQKWAETYGPVYTLMLGTKVAVVLSSDSAVKDLLDKRSAIYSGRPEMYMAQNIMSGGLRSLFMGNTPRWRAVRKLAHGVLNISVSRSYVPYQDLESKALLTGLLENPNDFFNHIRRYTTSLTTQMTFGYRTPTSDDPNLLEINTPIYYSFLNTFIAQTAVLLDFYPILRRLPEIFFPVIKRGRAYHEREKRLFMKHLMNARRQLRSGTAKPCCCIDLLQAQKEEGFSDEVACYLSGSLLQAGSETTAAILIGFFQAMLVFPEVAKAAQTEVDRVCGDRIPDLNDFPDMPYIRACMKESLRWMPATALGVPHAVAEDDTYLGYHIPKGAGVLLNVWGIQNDPHRHPDPRKYDPGRWAQDNQNSAQAAVNPDATKRDHFVFGAGRRLCQGIHIADRSLFLAMARTLWAFDLMRAIDPKSGKEIIPNVDNIQEGMFICPAPFAANIKPRNQERAMAVKNAWESMKGLLDDEMQWKKVPEGLKWRDYEPED
ncbi:cytochrome P450, putative [Talaromyces stipitatus ATCC 10500]|uniref:Cytochrome P450, putative n=1 Tax=Talaromyces stipitatus (strain ATCC 10500 / CBS 375.48 / QM 6759 / NRRL 1006) TaxID=441959 RepID=B8M0G8_TALSN|nr:cytochrome P450, putative [Talaromyces stipitatus ATCC 10500]EED21265.1 cytochrome P450, putative [Talaromyces stipitatus ATCC 10500]